MQFTSILRGLEMSWAMKVMWTFNKLQKLQEKYFDLNKVTQNHLVLKTLNDELQVGLEFPGTVWKQISVKLVINAYYVICN